MSNKEQLDNAMNELFGGLTAKQDKDTESTSSSVTSPSSSISPAQQKYRERNTRFCCIVEIELINKVREIARREGVPIKTVIDFMLKNGVESYEKTNGVLRVRKTASKKTDLSEAFGIKK